MNNKEKSILFIGEIPVSVHNSQVYSQTFIIENWMRRIVYTALKIQKGEEWGDIFSKEDIEKYLNNYNKRMENPILDCSESKNYLWFTTISELIKIINKNDIKELIQDLTGNDVNVILENLDTMKEIRNVVAHNRVVTIETLKIFEKVCQELLEAVKGFKLLFVYKTTDFQIRDEKIDEHEVFRLYWNRMQGNDWSRLQAFMTEDDYHFKLQSLPSGISLSQPFINVESLLKAFESVINAITGFIINKVGSEFTIVWPKSKVIPIETHEKIIDIFFNSYPYIWDDVFYTDQNIKHVCNPLIWYYDHEPSDEQGKYTRNNIYEDMDSDVDPDDIPF